jgi:hypothetical protein
MKNTEKENTKQLDNNKEQNIIAVAFNFVKFYDKETTNIEYKDNAIKEFESCSLETQILTLDYISDLFIKEYRTNRFYDLGQKHVDNFLELWNVLKSEDAKQKFAYKIDNGTIRFNENFMISEDSLIYKFYNNKYYDDFNTKIYKNKKMSTL